MNLETDAMLSEPYYLSAEAERNAKSGTFDWTKVRGIKMDVKLTTDDIVRDIREGRGYSDADNLEYDREFGTNLMGRKRELLETLKKKEAAMAAG
jgi:hypothetical protein